MVVSRLFRRASKPEPALHSVPEGERVYAVGDIHGRLDLLDALLDLIDSDDASRGAAETKLVFLGDLVDRGPQSREVIDRLAALKAASPHVRLLKGNHEEIYLLSAKGDVKAIKQFSRMGGKETILSYGVSEEIYRATDFDELARLWSEIAPRAHIDFLESFEDRIEIGDYLFVHAGIRPGVPIEAQKKSDLRWIRSEFLNCEEEFGKMVVHGHNITAAVDVRANRIGIDTGAFESDRLTAIGLEGGERWFLSTRD